MDDVFELMAEFFDNRTLYETQWAFWAIFCGGMYAQFS